MPAKIFTTNPVQKAAAAALLLLAAAAVIFIYHTFLKPQSLSLIIQDPRSGEVYYAIPAEPSDTFTLTYRHSVSNSTVYGTFGYTSDNKIIPLTTVYSTFGPGLPWPGDTAISTVRDGQVTVYHQEPPRVSLRLWVSPLTGETVTIQGREYILSALSEKPLLLEIFLCPR